MINNLKKIKDIHDKIKHFQKIESYYRGMLQEIDGDLHSLGINYKPYKDWAQNVCSNMSYFENNFYYKNFPNSK